MQKKKSTRSKANSLLLNILFVTLCLSGAAFSLWQFSKSFNQALVKQNEVSIATITFKRKTAQRKFMDRMLWDRLRQESPVYNGDTIRIAPQSEATIWFTDGNIMELFENTLAQVFISEKGLNAELAEGELTIDSRNAQTGVTLSSGNTAVKVESGSSLNAEKPKKDEGNFRVQVLEGQASLSGESESTISAGQSVSISGGEVSDSLSITLISPEPNEKILNYESKSLPVSFKWKTENISSEDFIILETSHNKDFSNIVEKLSFSNVNEALVSMESGTWYYRLYPEKISDEAEKNTLVRKFQILSAPYPELVVPASDYVFSYRTQKPPVRFIWTENDLASSYELTIADNPAMLNPVITQRCSTPSSIISSLEQGKWYWRVTPYYSINNIGLASPSKVQAFSIVKRGNLTRPELLIPAKGSAVNTLSEKGISFSWRNELEAISYTFKISKNQNLDSPIISKELEDNFYIVNPSKDNLVNGRYYWGVTQTDVEGNISQVSEVRQFVAVDGEVILRTVFPIVDYQIADSRVPDIRFTWKSNIPGLTRFQISNDRDFNSLVVDENVSSLATQGKQLEVGSYFWRISSGDEELALTTQARPFKVVPPLSAPENDGPEDLSRVIIRPNTPFKFSWKSVEGADYYSFKMYYVQNDTILVYEKNLLESLSETVDMENMNEGLYKWTVQAFSDETEFSTRRTGLLSTFSFNMKKLRPVSLNLPLDEQEIDGREAILNPGEVSWSSVDKARTSTFYLSKNENPIIEPVMKIEIPGFTVKLDRLYEGKYYWTISAMTEDELDISAERPHSFIITPIPPLSAPSHSSPEINTVFGPDYLKKSRKVTFKWDEVENASNYVFAIFDKNGNKIVEKLLDNTEYVLEDLAILDRGSFIWSVKAQYYLEENVLLQDGLTLESSFVIELPELIKPALNKTGTLYGK